MHIYLNVCLKIYIYIHVNTTPIFNKLFPTKKTPILRFKRWFKRSPSLQRSWGNASIRSPILHWMRNLLYVDKVCQMQVIKKKWSTDVYVDSVVKNFEVFFFPKVTGWFLEREILWGLFRLKCSQFNWWIQLEAHILCKFHRDHSLWGADCKGISANMFETFRFGNYIVIYPVVGAQYLDDHPT